MSKLAILLVAYVVCFGCALLEAVPCLIANDVSETNAWAAERVKAIGGRFTDPCYALSGGTAPKVTEQLNNTHLFLFQKDETELLPDWLQYHSYVFGIKNLHIIDHQSQNPRVCKLLAMYHHCGVNITYYDGLFMHKGGALSDNMKKMRNSIIVPMDADEFVVSFKKETNGKPRKFIMDKSHILEEFRNIPIDGRKYKFAAVHPVRHTLGTCLAVLHNTSSPTLGVRRVFSGGFADPTQYESFMTKGFYYSEGFTATDQGNHFGLVDNDKGKFNDHPDVLNNMTHYFYRMPSVALVHYQATSYVHLKAKILRGADAYGFKDGERCERHRPGSHHCILAQEYRLENDQSKTHYMSMCRQTREDSLSLTPFMEWFKRNALSLDDLVG